MHAPRPLDGLGVLITRPERQAATLDSLFQERGARVWRLPAIAIVAVDDARQQLARMPPLDASDLVILTSTNAAQHGLALFGATMPARLIAIGPATARAIENFGFTSVTPSAAFDSETLLALPELEHVQGRRVLIVKGRGGRDVLASTLRARGARVFELDAYERRMPTPAPALLEALETRMLDQEIQVVTASSVESVHNLLRMATPTLRAAFDRLAWLMPGSRVARGARVAGLAATIIEAPSGLDQVLVESLVRWRASASGA